MIFFFIWFLLLEHFKAECNTKNRTENMPKFAICCLTKNEIKSQLCIIHTNRKEAHFCLWSQPIQATNRNSGQSPRSPLWGGQRYKTCILTLNWSCDPVCHICLRNYMMRVFQSSVFFFFLMICYIYVFSSFRGRRNKSWAAVVPNSEFLLCLKQGHPLTISSQHTSIMMRAR